MSVRRSAGQYRAIDLALFMLMLCLFETIIITASARWFPSQPYIVSLVPAVTVIVMFRWNAWAALPAFLGGFVFCAVSGADTGQYLIYCAGNLFALLALIPLKKAGWEKISGDALLTVLFALLTVLLMQGGRAAVSLCMGHSPARAAGFFTTDVITDLFTAVICWIARRLDGILEDQPHYLKRIQQEKERGGIR